MPQVLIINSNFEYNRLLLSAGYALIASRRSNAYNLEMVKNADLVMFTGGADVHPVFYNGVHNGTSFVDKGRDDEEADIFKQCVKYGIKMTGICRGIQFLNVMCGGKMYQHINHHGGILHNVYFPATAKTVKVSSTHHQLVMLPEDALPMAWTHPHAMSDVYIGPNADEIEAPVYEIEAAVYPKYKAFGVQFHPEMLWCAKDGRDYYMSVLSDFMSMDFDTFVKTYAEVNHNEKGRAVEAN